MIDRETGPGFYWLRWKGETEPFVGQYHPRGKHWDVDRAVIGCWVLPGDEKRHYVIESSGSCRDDERPSLVVLGGPLTPPGRGDVRKLPLGVMPRSIWRERYPAPTEAQVRDRIEALQAAIGRAAMAHELPASLWPWLDELKELEPDGP